MTIEKSAIPNLKLGDEISVSVVPGISHHGIYVGNGEVVHMQEGENQRTFNRSSSSVGLDNFIIKKVSLDDFSQGKPVKALPRNQGFFGFFFKADPPETIVQRAMEAQGKQGKYSLLGSLDPASLKSGDNNINCEHFTTWCKTGRTYSRQVDSYVQNLFPVAIGAIGVGMTVLKNLRPKGKNY